MRALLVQTLTFCRHHFGASPIHGLDRLLEFRIASSDRPFLKRNLKDFVSVGLEKRKPEAPTTFAARPEYRFAPIGDGRAAKLASYAP